MKNRTRQILLNLNHNFYRKDEFKNGLTNIYNTNKNLNSKNNKIIHQFRSVNNLKEDENSKNYYKIEKNENYNNYDYSESNIDNKENNPYNINNSSTSYQPKVFYQKINNGKYKKYYINDIPISKKMSNVKKINNECLNKNRNRYHKNNLINNSMKKKSKNKNIINKINFNDDLIINKINKNSSSVNIFKRNKTDVINNQKYKSYLAQTTKNMKPKLQRENHYSNNLYLGNRTYIYKNNEILNTYFKNDIDNRYKIPKKSKMKNREIKSDFSNELNKTKNYLRNKHIICFNNEKNQSFSNESNMKINEKKMSPNPKIIKNRHVSNNKIRNTNNKGKNLKNLLFNFERLRQKKFMTRNLSNISINKFINEDGSKDDIRYKISKIKYLSPKINSQKNKINFLFTSKNKKNENITEIKTRTNNSNILHNFSFNNIDKFESNIEYSKSLLNNIKLEYNNSNNNCLEKDKFNNEINYFNIENNQNEICKNNTKNLIDSIPKGNNKIKYKYIKNKNIFETFNKYKNMYASRNAPTNEEE